jgi:hypothetical protein
MMKEKENQTTMNNSSVELYCGTTPKQHHDYWRSRPPTSQTISRGSSIAGERAPFTMDVTTIIQSLQSIEGESRNLNNWHNQKIFRIQRKCKRDDEMSNICTSSGRHSQVQPGVL